MTNDQFVKQLLTQILHNKQDNRPFNDEEALITSGRLDSVDVLDIVVSLESQFSLNFSERGINIDDFDSLTSILTMIREMQQTH